jgi:hypothetical protein
MEYTQEQHEAVRRSVEQLFRDVAARFPKATVREVPGPNRRNGLIELSCSLPGTARVSALPGADQIDLYVGAKTWLELMPTRRDPDKPLASVKIIVESVVAGRFEERIRLRRVRYLPYE